MKYITDLTKEELIGRRVLLRAGLDVPLTDKGEVADLYRIKRASLTLQFLRGNGAKVIILSHIGRSPSETNAPVARALNTHVPIVYISDILGAQAKNAISIMKEGEILLLENLRTDPREATNEESFARELASLADIYVDDAFSVAHRAHASIVGIPKYLPSYAGILMREEVEALSAARTPQNPSFAILGGAKFDTKEPLIKKLLENYDHVFVAGALANDVFKARGLATGISLISKELPDESVLTNLHFLAPVDVTVEEVNLQAGTKLPNEIKDDERIVDIGPETIALIAPYIMDAKYILWNGPTGLYEKGYTHYTHAIAELIAKSDAIKVIGGGDTIAAIEESGVDTQNLGFLSTGGGAMLEFLLNGTLPGIDALNATH